MAFVDPVRQCNECHVKTKKEKDFYETHLKALYCGICQFDIELMKKATIWSSSNVLFRSKIWIGKHCFSWVKRFWFGERPVVFLQPYSRQQVKSLPIMLCFYLLIVWCYRQIVFNCLTSQRETHDSIDLMEVDSVQLLSSKGESLAVTPSKYMEPRYYAFIVNWFHSPNFSWKFSNRRSCFEA